MGPLAIVVRSKEGVLACDKKLLRGWVRVKFFSYVRFDLSFTETYHSLEGTLITGGLI